MVRSCLLSRQKARPDPVDSVDVLSTCRLHFAKKAPMFDFGREAPVRRKARRDPLRPLILCKTYSQVQVRRAVASGGLGGFD